MNQENSRHALVNDDGPEENVDATLLKHSPDTPGDEKEAKKQEKGPQVGAFEIFRYANVLDRLLLFLGISVAIIHGSAFPSMVIVFGKSIGYFVEFGKLNHFLPFIHDFLNANNINELDIIRNPKILDETRCANLSSFYEGNITCVVSLHENIYDEMTGLAANFCILGCVVLIFGYAQNVFWIMSSERQANRIRKECLYNILCQSIGWFDMHNAAELNNRLSDDIAKIQDAIGDKMGSFFQWFTTSIVSFIIGFAYGWKLSLVVLAFCPLIFVVAALMHKVAASITSNELKEYAKAGAIAEEVFGAIRTVVAFGGQEKAALRYYKNLDKARSYGIKKGMFFGVFLGLFYLVMFTCDGIGFWYGGKLNRDEPENYSADTVIIVFISLLVGSYALGNASPSLESLSTGRGAAYTVFKLIELESPINSASHKGRKLKDLKGIIEFKNIHFSYPARPGVKVLKDVCLEVLPGQTVALVGASGCGKSTTVQLLLRFYDPDDGQIFLDGCDIKDLNIKWLRQSIGLVSQEPVLFATTIAENIRYGREDVTMDKIIAATKNANAYDFIMQLPEKFETFVGERGAQLSGGQKQRIAIARALVRDPKILLLDEATSSLDTESESIVQDALDKACKGRTTLIIAHRLSTIKNADVIIGYQDGQVMETGDHDKLMDQKGIYYQLVTNQMTAELNDDEEGEDILGELNMENLSKRRLSRKFSFASYDEKKEDDSDDDDTDLPDAPFTRLIKMSKPEWYFIVLGCVGSMINGCVYPAFSVLFSGIMSTFAEDVETQKEEFRNYALLFVGLGVLSLFTKFLESSMFGFSGEALTRRLRDLTFRAMIKQDIAWFDDPKNGVGALTTRLSLDASQVQGVTGVRVGSMINGCTTMIVALMIGFIYGWLMSLVLLAFLPFIAVGDFIKIRLFAGQAGKNKEAFEGAGKITVESVGNIRTVASLSKEETFFSLYMEKLKAPYEIAMRNAHIVGIAFSFSQSALYFFYASAFVFGAYMIEEGEMTTRDVFRVFCAIVFGAMGMGNASALVPDLGKAKTSAKRILHILDSKVSIDHTNTGGEKLANNYSANLVFKDVAFYYPTRQTVPVLKGLNFSVTPGQTLALVGSSGCGKTTTVQLMERFYDAINGSLCLDNQNIKTLNIEWLRSQMALVSQEPVLFDQTIAENIAFGDNSRDVPMEEIVGAARTANIHNFITSLPDGYETNVGAKGTQLSGGQKQRVAIARALVRDPRILLLDEATSSLDTESEKVVQGALDKAREGRTCVVIAHRLSTVQNADKICVISHGRVTEQGTHNELMAMKGFYHKLIEKSMRTA